MYLFNKSTKKKSGVFGGVFSGDSYNFTAPDERCLMGRRTASYIFHTFACVLNCHVTHRLLLTASVWGQASPPHSLWLSMKLGQSSNVVQKGSSLLKPCGSDFLRLGPGPLNAQFIFYPSQWHLWRLPVSCPSLAPPSDQDTPFYHFVSIAFSAPLFVLMSCYFFTN